MKPIQTTFLIIVATKQALLLLMFFLVTALNTVGADILADLKAVKIDGRKYADIQIRYIANDIEERGNKALMAAGKDRFSIWMGGIMGGASYLFRDVDLPQTSIYDAILRIADTVNCIVSTNGCNERTVLVEPRGESVDESAGLDKLILDAKHYTSEPLTNIVDDVWRRTNDALFETSRWGIIVYYPHVATNLSISIPSTNAMDAFKLVAQSIKADVSFDGYFLEMSILDENTEIACLLKNIRIDAFDIPLGSRFYDGMESLRRQINLRHIGNDGESVKFEYYGAQTNLPMAAIRLVNISAFEAVSNICHRTHRCFSCDATSRTVSIGLEAAEYAERFKQLRFQGGRFTGNTVYDAFHALLSAINANLERNDLLTVGVSMQGVQLAESPLCIDVKPCTTWEAFEQFARITGCQVRWEHPRVCYRVVDGASIDGAR